MSPWSFSFTIVWQVRPSQPVAASKLVRSRLHQSIPYILACMLNKPRAEIEMRQSVEKCDTSPRLAVQTIGRGPTRALVRAFCANIIRLTIRCRRQPLVLCIRCDGQNDYGNGGGDEKSQGRAAIANCVGARMRTRPSFSRPGSNRYSTAGPPSGLFLRQFTMRLSHLVYIAELLQGLMCWSSTCCG